ncbi:hypothetical protein JCM3775_001024 [Rhodotorula graminis]
MALTLEALISSLLGWITAGVAMAAFVPLIATNAVKRRSGTGPGFLFAWLVADAVNLAGIALLGAQPTQIVLAAWYCVADGALALELGFFGHSDWGTRDPKRAKDLIRRIQRHETPWWFKLTTHFRDYTVWDDIVLLTVLVLLCTTIWGAYMTTGLWLNPDSFSVHAPTEWDTISFALGISASLIFSFARIPEFISGERRSKRNDEPVHDLDDPLFYYLILENIFNLASIFTLSRDVDYIKVESPWIIGSLLSILFDSILVWRITVWRKKFFNDKNPAWRKIKAARATRDNVRKKLKDELEEREEEWRLQDILQDKDDDLVDVKLGAGFWDKRHAKKHNANVHQVRQEYAQQESHPVIQGLHTRIAKRAKRDAAVNKYDDHVKAHGRGPSSDEIDEDNEKRHHVALDVHDPLDSSGFELGGGDETAHLTDQGWPSRRSTPHDDERPRRYHERISLSRPGSRAQERRQQGS